MKFCRYLATHAYASGAAVIVSGKNGDGRNDKGKLRRNAANVSSIMGSGIERMAPVPRFLVPRTTARLKWVAKP